MTDVNDNAPRFVRSFYEFDLRSVNTKEIGRVDAKDDDLGAGGVVKFRLVEQTEVRSGLSKLLPKKFLLSLLPLLYITIYITL